MVATRPIKAFEPVVLDQALAFGPCEHTKPRCLACLKLLDEVSTVCPECNLPMCDLEVINVKLAVIVFACWTLANHRVGEKPKKEGANYGSSKVESSLLQIDPAPCWNFSQTILNFFFWHPLFWLVLFLAIVYFSQKMSWKSSTYELGQFEVNLSLL